ncbi:MAG: GNAT family N-acetyltransferase [bacterium]|nr:GNAT family N-acetyltransferase [bacterium]
MDLFERYYSGYKGGIYTIREVALAFQGQNISTEELEGRNYDPTFLAIINFQATEKTFIPAKRRNIDSIGLVRLASKKDASVIEELFYNFEKELYGKVKDSAPDNVLVLEHSPEDLSQLGVSVFEPGIAGALWYQINSQDQFFVHSLYVKPELRKFHCGKRLMEEVLNEYAESFGCRSVALRSPEEVVPFYKKLGFSYDPKRKNEAGTCRSLIKRLV